MTDDMQQTHPLYAIDRDQIDAVLGHEGAPGPQQLTTIAALFFLLVDWVLSNGVQFVLGLGG